MHFRLRYIIREFEFGDAQISVSDPVKQINVLITKRSLEEKHPPFEVGQGVATATCQREIPKRHHDAAISSGILSANRDSVRQVHKEMNDLILHILRLARWRTASPKSGPNPIRWAAGFDWSVDGMNWKSVADNLSVEIGFSSPFTPWTTEAEQFVRTEALGELDEPLGHELLREALVNSHENLRSCLILAVVAAEVGFKQFAALSFPNTDWILKNLPSPPLVTMLQEFPWSRLGVLINGKVPRIPAEMEKELKKVVYLRNQIIHSGSIKPERETVDSALRLVHDFLYFLDGLCGQKWALNNMRPDMLRQVAS